MLEITLQHPIHTLGGRELIPPGVKLTEDVMKEVIASNTRPKAKSMPLMEFGTVKHDVFQFLATPPYKIIFNNHKDAEDILDFMEQLKQPMPVLESLEYFREHDFHTYRHMLMICALSTLLAKILIPDFQQRLHNATAGTSHDLGKVCVPLDILMKSDPLAREERNILHQHSVAGYVLLCYYSKDMTDFSAEVARDHHERLDGSGYMCGMKLIDPLVEIVAVCDVYDALISPRPYRPVSYDNRTALEEVTSMAERGQISWDVLLALISLNRKDKPDFRDFKISQEKRGTPPQGNTYGKTANSDT
jgi:HD-GYP domain-containing protein (c-di-GMP phosphodiesterase class II)